MHTKTENKPNERASERRGDEGMEILIIKVRSGEITIACIVLKEIFYDLPFLVRVHVKFGARSDLCASTHNASPCKLSNSRRWCDYTFSCGENSATETMDRFVLGELGGAFRQREIKIWREAECRAFSIWLQRFLELDARSRSKEKQKVSLLASIKLLVVGNAPPISFLIRLFKYSTKNFPLARVCGF